MALRFDLGTLRSPRTNATGLVVDAYITRTGVFRYLNQDGTERLELRDDSEVFNDDSLSTFQMLTVTDDHPPEALNPANAKTYACGSVGETVRKDGDKVAAPLSIFDVNLIKKVQDGKSQISCGYTCDIEEVSGTHPVYGRYDVMQRNIRGNHVAVVDMGRAGPAVSIRMDGHTTATMIPPKDFQMDELQKLLAAALKDAAEQRARADTAEVQLVDAKARLDVAEALALGEKSRADAAEKVRLDTVSGFAAHVAARVALVHAANQVMKLDGIENLSDRQIKIEFVKKVDGITVDESRSDVFVDALYTSALTRSNNVTKEFGSLRTAIESGRSDVSSLDPETASRQRMITNNAARLNRGV